MDKFETLEENLLQIGKEWAEHKAIADNLERVRTSLLSQIMLEHLGEPVNLRETRAKADERYKNHLQAQKEVETKANTLFVKWTHIRIQIENLRTKTSYKKAEMNLL